MKISVLLSCVAGTAILFSSPLSAQTRPKDGECKVDEVDMGDYCASLPPAISEDEKKRRRITRFRGESMMPGRTGAKPATPARPTKPVPPAQPPAPAGVIPEDGFVVQLGAFSSREMAESIAASIAVPPGPARVISLDRGDHVLWACLLGPFEDHESAVASRDLAQKDKRFKSAYVKEMNPELTKGLVHDNIEE